MGISRPALVELLAEGAVKTFSTALLLLGKMGNKPTSLLLLHVAVLVFTVAAIWAAS